jgi:hypothetical protein
VSIGLVIAVVVACAAVVAAAVVVVLTRRSFEQRLERLSAGIGYSAELAASLDPDDVLERTLDAVVALPGVDAALIAIGVDAATRTTRAAGLSEDEIERTLVQMPGHSDLRALEVSYRYRLDAVDGASKLPRAALTVLLRSEGEPFGSLAAISRSHAAGFPESTEAALDGLARTSARGR